MLRNVVYKMNASSGVQRIIAEVFFLWMGRLVVEVLWRAIKATGWTTSEATSS
ncbi:hypothetical protein PPTG_20988 [Phytophthora nicotianae INRA-310]|uniref:Uncharacterized protein n=1 Tax=Phytophthora nicotianae (strain INRA-310) TaxID=761204 RepID=W2RFM5_PHYN3|nr:hypothetical protein PPTG_20988 [Phytophthora nicotianae INRA-310]ETN23315.1 hypothetical protein PPTG_20988 [Phytophthora nicotianae INRA-310]